LAPPATTAARTKPRRGNAPPPARRSAPPTSVRLPRAASPPKPARAAKPAARQRGTASALKRTPRSPRRVSGPARRRTPTLPQFALPQLPGLGQLRPLPVIGTIGSHAFRVGRRLPDSALFDRLVRGRTWIGLLAVLLFGLVAINVSLLKLNSEAGRNAERLKSLRIHNDRLHATVSRLSSDERIQRVAARLGLVMPDAASVQYVRTGRSDGSRAARAILADRRLPGEETLADAVLSTPLALTPTVAAPTAAAPPVAVPAGTTGPQTTVPDVSQPAATTAPIAQPDATAGTTAPAAGAQTGAAVAPTAPPATGATGQQPVG
jgi:cell division protein FtsL